MTPSLPSVDANVGVLLSKSQYIYSVGLINRMNVFLEVTFQSGSVSGSVSSSVLSSMSGFVSVPFLPTTDLNS